MEDVSRRGALIGLAVASTLFPVEQAVAQTSTTSQGAKLHRGYAGSIMASAKP